MRLVEELEKKPTVLFLENVKNFSSHDNGKTLSKVANIIQEDYGILFWKVLNTRIILKYLRTERELYDCVSER